MKNLYSEMISKLITSGFLNPKNDTILVVGGGPNDLEPLIENKINNAVITNVSHHGGQIDYAPYKWEKADLSDLHYARNSF